MVNKLSKSHYRRTLARIRNRHLLCFMEIAHYRRIGLAADVLNVSQPAVSKTLRELEDILETTLFRRGGKGGLALTATGVMFLRYAGASIAALKEGLDALSQAQLQGALTLKIGALPTVAARVMPAVTSKFKQQHTALLKIITGPNSFLLNQLRLGELDLVVGRLPDIEEMVGFSFSYLYSEEVRLAVRADHPWPDQTTFDLSLLEDMTVLLPTTDSIIRPAVDRLLMANGVGTLSDRIETVSPDFCRQYVLESDAVWIISEGVIAPDIHSGMLRMLNVDTSDTRGAVGLTTRSDSDPSPMLRSLMETISSVARDMPAPTSFSK